jgi:hypothetical protein
MPEKSYPQYKADILTNFREMVGLSRAELATSSLLQQKVDEQVDADRKWTTSVLVKAENGKQLTPKLGVHELMVVLDAAQMVARRKLERGTRNADE